MEWEPGLECRLFVLLILFVENFPPLWGSGTVTLFALLFLLLFCRLCSGVGDRLGVGVIDFAYSRQEG
jgi:hypothetical protein